MKPRRRPWTPSDLDTLRERYADTPTAQIAEQLGRTTATVYAVAYRLGLKKSDAFLASTASGRTMPGDTRGVDGRFKPGHTTWNKGTHWTAGGRSAETRFKPGRKPEEARNYVPIGSLRVNKGGCLERKVTDDQSIVPARRWLPVRRLVWEAAHGPVPEGHVVVFKPGRSTTELEQITLDALELVSHQELMRRNTLHRYPKEITRNIQLLGAIRRQINRRTA